MTAAITEQAYEEAINGELMTPIEAARLLRVSRALIYRWMDSGVVRYVQIGPARKRLLPRAAVLELLTPVSAK